MRSRRTSVKRSDCFVKTQGVVDENLFDEDVTEAAPKLTLIIEEEDDDVNIADI